MLHSVRGVLLESDEDYAVVDIQGLRLRLDIPGSTAAQLGESGSTAELLTSLSFNANDGTFSLFGFATAIERNCFDVLLSMSGIGPRKALMILSQIEVGSFARAIVSQDLDYVSKIKGVGKKTAERLVVELREKMVHFVDAAPSEPALPTLSRKENVSDAVQAMTALGTRPAIAERAIQKAVDVLGDDATTEELIREGLKHR